MGTALWTMAVLATSSPLILILLPPVFLLRLPLE